jgi:hypothetical protein
MTETQLRLFPAFRTLPVYDESDGRSHGLAAGPGRGTAVRECTTLAEVQACLADPTLVPLGGVRAGEDGQHVVVVYFGRAT